jgi:hypothetical protein
LPAQRHFDKEVFPFDQVAPSASAVRNSNLELNQSRIPASAMGLLHANGRKLKLFCNIPEKADLVGGNKNRKPVQNFAEGKDRPCVCLSRRRQQLHTAL